MSSIYTNEDVIFKRSVRVGDTTSITEASSETHYGTIRYNSIINRFEGLHRIVGADHLGNPWRMLTSDIATPTTLGTIKIGNNLFINPLTGVLNAVGGSDSLQKAHIIRISPYPEVADFTSISQAIKETIIDGSISSISGIPELHNQYIIEILPGYSNDARDIEIILPDYVSLKGYSTRTTFLKSNITLGTYSSISNLTLEGSIQSNCHDDILLENLEVVSGKNVISIQYGERHFIRNVKGDMIHLEQCSILIDKLYCNSVLLKNCNPIEIKDIITLENTEILKSMVCNNSMFKMINSKLNTNILLEDADTDGRYLETTFRRNGNGNKTKFELVDVYNSNSRNLIRLGFLEGAKIYCLETKTYHTIIELGLLYIILDKEPDNVDMNGEFITFIQCNSIILENVSIVSAFSTIQSANMNYGYIYYYIHCKNLKQLGGGEPMVNNKLVHIEFNKSRRILVGDEDYHYRTVSSALHGISNPSKDFKFIIEILEGYNCKDEEGKGKGKNELRLKEFVDIVSIGNCSLTVSFIHGYSCSNIIIENIRFLGLKGLDTRDCNGVVFKNCYFECNDKWNIKNSNITFIDCIIIQSLVVGDGDDDAVEIEIEGIRCINVSMSILVFKNTIIETKISRMNNETSFENSCALYLTNSNLRMENTDMTFTFSCGNILKDIYIGGYIIDCECNEFGRNGRNGRNERNERNERNGDFEELEFLAIQCVFNRSIYINPKIKQKKINCSIPVDGGD